MRRIFSLMVVAALMAAMLVAMAMPAFAARSGDGGPRFASACDVDTCAIARGGGGGGSGQGGGGGGGGGTNMRAGIDECDPVTGQCAIVYADRTGGGGGGGQGGSGGGGSGADE